MKKNQKPSLRVALVAPHIFLHQDIIDKVIFSPGQLAIDLANNLSKSNVAVTFFTPGPVRTLAKNVTADLSLFKAELEARGDDYLDLLKKHPFIFISLARQGQAELIAEAYARANQGEFDVVHVYTLEEEMALPFSKLTNKPVLFTHHDPFNYLIKYKSSFPKYKELNWLSLSYAQRKTMPDETNWVGNIYHGLPIDRYKPVKKPSSDYLLFVGRIIKPKGLHLAIEAAKRSGLKLKIAGKHYSGYKDEYWLNQIEPELSDQIEYLGFINEDRAKNELLANAKALIVPSIYNEPFGMVTIEALASATPVIGFNIGATPEIIKNGETGIICDYTNNEDELISSLVQAIKKISDLDRSVCRADFETRFSLDEMTQQHIAVYNKLKNN